MQTNFLKNLFYLALPLFLGSIIGLIISGSIDYPFLKQPPLSPPSYLFPIMWSIIYILLSISFYLYQNKGIPNKTLDKVYYYSLAINLLWSIFFFILKWRLFTVIWTILLLGSVIYLLYLYFKYYKPSFYLNLLYLLWVIFATYLTIGIAILN